MNLPSPLQKVETSWSKEAQINLWVKREDLIHPQVSGNKFRKLKYNLLQAQTEGKTRVLSFGGAYSNHIHALAAYCKLIGLESIGVIRGDEITRLNPTLQDAQDWGMQLKFVDRTTYRNKTDASYIETLRAEFGDFYLIPEGGTNTLAHKGTQEIIEEINIPFDYICSAVGTGGTIAGLIKSCPEDSKILGFSALKGNFLDKEVEELAGKNYTNWEIKHDFHCGGYGKVNQELWEFISEFKTETGIQLEPIYTGKMFLGLKKMVQSASFQLDTNIIALHTGGLQGLRGFENTL